MSLETSINLLPGSYWWYDLPSFLVFLISFFSVVAVWGLAYGYVLLHNTDIWWYWVVGVPLLFILWLCTPYVPWTTGSWIAVALGVTLPFWAIIVD